MKYDYIQANPPCLRAWMIFDVDRERGGAAEAGMFAWEDANLPEPTWACQNPENGNAHLCWGLRIPVLVDVPSARIKPIRYLASVEAGLRAKLNADEAYGGLITKNPASPRWRTLRGRRMNYELGELAEFVDLATPQAKRTVQNIGIWRNVTLFEWLRKIAYRDVGLWKARGNDERWADYLFQQAIKRNSTFPTPMLPAECRGIAKSVGHWTWTRFEVKDRSDDVKWRRKQAHRGSKKGAKGRELLLPRAQAMVEQGHSNRFIATKLGINRQTVANWLRKGWLEARIR